MTVKTWSLQIFAVSSSEAQEEIQRMLRIATDIYFEKVITDSDHYVIIHSSGNGQARAVRRFVLAVDPAARLIHETQGVHGSRTSQVAGR